MQKLGVSCYPGFHNTVAEIEESLPLAARHGVTEVFTSLHIPESDFKRLFEECRALCRIAHGLGMRVTADVSPLAFEKLGATTGNLKPFRDLGLDAIRQDFGFEAQKAASMINNPEGLGIMLNASDTSEAGLAALRSAGARFDNVSACHNFYPRKYSGLSLEAVIAKSLVFHEAGIPTAAFVASRAKRRAITYEGLPTVEDHRELPPERAAQELFLTGVIDMVLVGDPLTPEEELRALSAVPGRNAVVLRVACTPGLAATERKILFEAPHRQGPGAGYSHVVRSAASRQFGAVQPAHGLEREVGCVTIDNANYGRYGGELQIVLRPQEADPRVNVVARVIEEDMPLLRWIDRVGDFRFVEA